MANKQVVEVKEGNGAMRDALKDVFELGQDDSMMAMVEMEEMEAKAAEANALLRTMAKEMQKDSNDPGDEVDVPAEVEQDEVETEEEEQVEEEQFEVETEEEQGGSEVEETETEEEPVQPQAKVAPKPLTPVAKQAVKPKVVEVGLFSEHAPVLGKKAITMLNRYVAAMDVTVSARPNERNQISKQRELDHLYREILTSANATDKITALIKIFRSHVVFTESLIFRHTINIDTARVSSEHFTKVSSVFTTAAREGIGAVTKVIDLDLLLPSVSQHELNVLKAYFK